MPLATGSYDSDKKKIVVNINIFHFVVNINIFHFDAIFAFIISLAKQQTFSNHDVLARNKERMTFSLFLLVLIISISIHLFIHLKFSVSLILQNI